MRPKLALPFRAAPARADTLTATSKACLVTDHVESCCFCAVSSALRAQCSNDHDEKNTPKNMVVSTASTLMFVAGLVITTR